MRLFVLFDLPTETAEDRRNYSKFRRGLIKSGFYMIQESVYCKMVINQSAQTGVKEAVRKIKPPSGSVIMFSITEKQFSNWEYITGTHETDVIDTDERLVIL